MAGASSEGESAGTGSGSIQCGERFIASLLHLLLLLGEPRGQRIQDVVVVVVGLEPDPRFEIGCGKDPVEEGKGGLHGA